MLLTGKKSKFFYGEKNVVIIYCYKARIVNLFVFQQFVFHAVSSILGVKVPVTCISPKFSYLFFMILHIFIIYPYKLKDNMIWECIHCLKVWSRVYLWGKKTNAQIYPPSDDLWSVSHQFYSYKWPWFMCLMVNEKDTVKLQVQVKHR